MLKELLERIASFAVVRSAFDPSQFGDPVAEQTEWTPAKGGGANFRTHRLARTNPNRIEFHASLGAKTFYGIFFVIGVGVILGMGIPIVSQGESLVVLLFPLLFGGVFATVGGLMFYFGTAPIVFDKRCGYFWKGRKSPEHVFDKASLKHYAELDNIHALQIVAERISGSKSSYTSYELNLVLEDGKRINVVDHGNLRRLREDAVAVAEFLEKPLWDALCPCVTVGDPEQ